MVVDSTYIFLDLFSCFPSRAEFSVIKELGHSVFVVNTLTFFLSFVASFYSLSWIEILHAKIKMMIQKS